MRELVHDAVADAREVVGELVREGREADVLTDDEVLAEYEGVRGDPLAVIEFSARRVGPGGMSPESVAAMMAMQGQPVPPGAG